MHHLKGYHELRFSAIAYDVCVVSNELNTVGYKDFKSSRMAGVNPSLGMETYFTGATLDLPNIRQQCTSSRSFTILR